MKANSIALFSLLWVSGIMLYNQCSAQSAVTFLICNEQGQPIKSNFSESEPPPVGPAQDTKDDGMASVKAGTQKVYVKPLKYKSIYEEGPYETPPNRGKLVLRKSVENKRVQFHRLSGDSMTVALEQLDGVWRGEPVKPDKNTQFIDWNESGKGFVLAPLKASEFKGFVVYKSEIGKATFGQAAFTTGNIARWAVPTPAELAEWERRAGECSLRLGHDDQGKALILYAGVATWTDFAARADSSKWGKTATAAKQQVFTQAGKLLSVEGAVDYVNGQVVPSTELSGKLLDFQAKVNLPTTGILDWATISRLTDIPEEKVPEIIGSELKK